jgi:hypothetical protein
MQKPMISGSMWWLLDALLILAYYVVGKGFSERAYRHLTNKNATPWDVPLMNEALFTEAGKVARRRAILYWTVGAVLILLYYLLIRG